MFEIKILCPPINLYSKPWQHAFDKRYVMDANKHPAMKIYWERCGKPQLMFKLGDDPWVEVAGEPSWNPAFEYRVKGTTLQAVQDAPGATRIAPRERVENHYSDYDRGFNQGYDNGFKQGYNKALEDIKTHLHEKHNRK